jgi:hypothetical protein
MEPGRGRSRDCGLIRAGTGHLWWDALNKKGKAIPLQAWTGPEGPRKLRFPDKTICT